MRPLSARAPLALLFAAAAVAVPGPARAAALLRLPARSLDAAAGDRGDDEGGDGSAAASSAPDLLLLRDVRALRSSPAYTPSECEAWRRSILLADLDSSRGLNESEFLSFLKGIDDPPRVAAYFAQNAMESYADLPWLFQVAHKTLACRCEDLGMGAGCCEGDDPEVPLVGMAAEGEDFFVGEGGTTTTTTTNGTMTGETTDQTPATSLQFWASSPFEVLEDLAAEYRADACNLLAVIFREVVPADIATVAPVPASDLAAAPTAAPFEDALVQGVPGSIDSGASSSSNATEDPASPPSENSTGTAATNGTDGAADVTDSPVDPSPLVISDVLGSVLDYRATDYRSYTAAEYQAWDVPNAWNVQANTTRGLGALDHVIWGFLALCEEIVAEYAATGWEEELAAAAKEGRGGGGGGRRRRGRVLEEGKAELIGGSYVELPPKVTDVVCPSGLTYAPQGGYCLNFRFEVHMPNMSEDYAEVFSDKLTEEIDDTGKLYDLVNGEYPDGPVTGLGRPGKGIDWTKPPLEETGTADAATVSSGANKAGDDEGPTGLPTWAIVLIVLALIAVPMAIVALFARRRNMEEQERKRTLAEYEAKQDLEAAGIPREIPDLSPVGDPAEEDDEESSSSSSSSELSVSTEESDIVQFDDIDEEAGTAQVVTAGSALAAMGVMGSAEALKPENMRGSGSE
ncbi:hypothetical protein ACHAWF_010942 [Thalassiosira exigua]